MMIKIPTIMGHNWSMINYWLNTEIGEDNWDWITGPQDQTMFPPEHGFFTPRLCFRHEEDKIKFILRWL